MVATTDAFAWLVWQVPPHGRPEDNAAFHGEEGRMRKKTDMCRAFQRGECHWGSDCNYAHDEEVCHRAKLAYERWKISRSTRIVTNSSLKLEEGGCEVAVCDNGYSDDVQVVSSIDLAASGWFGAWKSLINNSTAVSVC